ncbi:MAG: SDR family NAD(P)-dependent oxidoreductase [Vibrionaceae bacterium]
MKRILITGATSGIGKQLAIDYQKAGWQVWGSGRNNERLQALAQAGIFPLHLDGRVAEKSAQLASKLPPLDLLILNAGDCEYIDMENGFDSALFARVIENNVIATGHTLAAFLPLLKQGGRLAIVSSSVTWLPLPRAQAYGASKAALDYLANSLRIELAEKEIGVTLIKPGFVKTPLSDKNTFAMPCLLDVEQASLRIQQGLTAGRHEIAFPRRLIWPMRLLGALPHSLWLALALSWFSKRNKE